MKVISSIVYTEIHGSREHSHGHWEFIYRLRGVSDTKIDGTVYRINEGDAYLIPPEIIHSDLIYGSVDDLILHIEGFEIDRLLILRGCDSCVYAIADLINSVMNKMEENYQRVADSLADALYNCLNPLSSATGENRLVNKLKELIVENIENPDFVLTSEMIGLGYHPHYVRRRFKEEMKKTPLTYLTELRIDKAKKLLSMYTCESVEAVSARCGFRDSFYFSTCFKKHTGISPLQYRKRSLND